MLAKPRPIELYQLQTEAAGRENLSLGRRRRLEIDLRERRYFWRYRIDQLWLWLVCRRWIDERDLGLNDGGEMSIFDMTMPTPSAAGSIGDNGVGSITTGPASSRSTVPCRSVAAPARWATVDR